MAADPGRRVEWTLEQLDIVEPMTPFIPEGLADWIEIYDGQVLVDRITGEKGRLPSWRMRRVSSVGGHLAVHFHSAVSDERALAGFAAKLSQVQEEEPVANISCLPRLPPNPTTSVLLSSDKFRQQAIEVPQLELVICR
jgi:hypothetical protein